MSGLWSFRPPSAYQGLAIGLFGGSFDPAHQGHWHLAMTARKRLGLDYIWWLPSPGHSLKAAHSSFATRLASARQYAQAPFMRVSSADAHFSSPCTLHLVRSLQSVIPQARLVWLIGEDCLTRFHQWIGWVELVQTLPLASIARPGTGPKARLCPFARRFAHARLPASSARRLAYTPAPAWLHLNAPYRHVSSSFLKSGSGA